MRSYKPEELFDADGRLLPELAELAPKGDRRMGANPHANGGMLLRDLRMPDFRDHAVDGARARRRGRAGHPRAGQVPARRGQAQRGPAELPDLRSRRDALQSCWARSSRSPTASGKPRRSPDDEFLAPDGRVLDSMLSEHQCEGWLEGYLLTGRHGLFNCYEAFIHIVDSMFNQHAKWLKVTCAAALAAEDRLAELPAHLPRLAAGPQRLHAPGPRLPRPRHQQEGRASSGSTCRRTPTACCRSWTIACAAGTTSTSSSPASTRCRSG